jgi:HK97 family phage prohead protease
MKKMVVPFEVKQITEDEEYFIFEGYCSTYLNVDRGMDAVMPGAFIETVAELMGSKKTGKLPALWQHESDMPIGSYTEFRDDSHGLFVKGRLPKSDTFVSGRVIPQMKAESVTSMSIGYSTIDYVIEGGVRLLKKLKLWEISLVTTPMNALAEITGFKSADHFQDLPLAQREQEWDAEAAAIRVKEHLQSVDAPSDIYRKDFLWYDEHEAEDFGAYKLPIADVIDGKLTAIPRAIFAAAAALNCKRNDSGIPDEDRESVIAHIERYYAKMDLESPFNEKSTFRVDDLTVLTERELEKLFKSGVCFTNSTSKRLVAALKTFLREEEGLGNRDDSKQTIDAEFLKQLKAVAEFANAQLSIQSR